MARLRRPSVVVALVLFLALLVGGQAPVTSVTAAPASQAVDTRPLIRRIAFGAHVEGMTATPARLGRFEKLVGRRAAIASLYWGYGDVFPGALEKRLSDGGRRKVLLSWDMGPTRFSEWSAGRHDDYLDQIVAAASAYPHAVFVRPWPEMNGDWQTFQPTAAGEKRHGGTYTEFKVAWRYLVTYFRDRGVRNIRWVFNPTSDVYAETTPVNRIWPGAAYVDVLGLDGFNWGRDSSWGRWQEFRAIFYRQYARLTRLHQTAPVWICETSSKEPRTHDGAPRDSTHSKGEWIRTAMTTRDFPRLRAVVWFQADKERDWRVNSSTVSLRAMRLALRR